MSMFLIFIKHVPLGKASLFGRFMFWGGGGRIERNLKLCVKKLSMKSALMIFLVFESLIHRYNNVKTIKWVSGLWKRLYAGLC
jgi:hypothetical protein